MSLGLRTSGRAAKPLHATFEKELDEMDILSLGTERDVKPPAVKKLRERHHALARYLAEGKSESEAAILCRYDISRVSILKGDPAFLDLIEHYRGIVNEQFVDFQVKLKELAIDAALALQERLEENPDDIADGMLLRIVEVGADRTGHGPSQKSELNVKIGLADRISGARERQLAMRVLKDVTPQEDSDG